MNKKVVKSNSLTRTHIVSENVKMKKRQKVKGFESIYEIKSHPKKFENYYSKVSMLCDGLPYDFRKKLRYLRESIGMTREKLEEKSYISYQTIKEIETNKKRGYSLETIIALCIGMNLPPEFSFDLIKMSGFYIDSYDNEKSCLYCYILRNLYDCEIEDINQILEINNFDSLS